MPINILQTKALIRTLCLSKSFIRSNSLTPLKSLVKGRVFCTVKMNLNPPKMPAADSKCEGLLIKDIVEKLESWAPLHLAGSWDRVGLQVEPSGQCNRVSCLLVTNDLTQAVVEEAIARGGIGMIISYHPPIFQPLRTLTNRTWKERVITACIENKIAVYTPHTAWDAVKGGVNDWLASAFESSSVEPLTVSKTWVLPSSSKKLATHLLEITVLDRNVMEKSSTKKLEKYAQAMGAHINHIINAEDDCKIISIGCDENSLKSLVEYIQSSSFEFTDFRLKVSKCEQIPWPGYGEGRLCVLKAPLPLKQIVEIVKQHLKLKNVRLAVACHSNSDSPVHSVALCAGSGSSVLSGVKADVLLTGEMGHHDVLEANHRGSHVILCEHSNTERGFLCSLVNQGTLHKILGGNVEVIMSSRDQEPLQIV